QFFLPALSFTGGLIFFPAFSLFLSGNNDGQTMLPAKPVTDITDSIQALFVGDILPVLDKISSAEYQVIMYMPFVNVSCQHIFILPAENFFCQFLSNPVRVLIGHFPRLKGLNQMVR